MNSAHLLKYSLKSLYSATLWIQLLHFLLHAIYFKALVASYLLIYAHSLCAPFCYQRWTLFSLGGDDLHEEMVHCGYKQMDTVSSNTQVGFGLNDAQLRGPK